jgi:broad specificity phosphatase PhoE
MKVVTYFVRHAQTELNKDADFKGELQVGLNDAGKEQALELAELFKDRKISAAFRSKLKRAQETAAPILAGRNVRATPTSDLNSLDVGDLAGQPKNDKNLDTMNYYQDHTEEKIPGGESIDEFRRRVDPKVLSIIHKGEEAGQPTLAVVHGSIIREISRFINKDEHNGAKVKPGGIVGIFKSPSGYVAKALYRKSNKPDDDRFGS